MSIGIQKVVSPGGIPAWLIESREAPIVTMRIDFRGGSAQDPPDRPGLARVLGYMFNEGAGPLSPHEFFARRDRIGGTIGANATMDEVAVSFEAVSEHLEETMELLVLAMSQPRLDEDAITRARKEFVSEYEGALRNPRSQGGQAFLSLLYGEHRMAAPHARLLETMRSVEAQELAAARRRLYARDNAAVSVTGDIDATTLGRWLDRIFESLPVKAQLRNVAPPVYAGPRQRLIEAQLPQALVQFGAQVPRLSVREQMANVFLQGILNDGLVGRLFTEVREKRGLVYSVYASYGESPMVTTFSGSFGSSNETSATALRTTIDTLARMAHDGPTEEEMANQRDAIPGHFLLGLEGRGNLIGQMSSMQRSGKPIDFLDTYVDTIRTITTAEVTAVARKVIRPELFSVVAVGKPNPPLWE